jgi:dTMP kinase
MLRQESPSRPTGTEAIARPTLDQLQATVEAARTTLSPFLGSSLDVAPPLTRRRGLFLVLEGGDRVGKSTQARLLCEHPPCRERPCDSPRGREPVLLRFPDRDSAATGAILDSYLKGELSLSAMESHALFSANRWEKAPRIIRLLDEGVDVISDRYAFSGAAYSAAAHGLSFDECKDWDAGLPEPDAVFLLKCGDTADVAERAGWGDEIYERRALQRRVGEDMDRQSASAPPRWLVVDASETVEAVAAELKSLREEVALATDLLSRPRPLWTSDEGWKPARRERESDV